MQRVLLHTIAETGRHAGHADILRERIDCSTGRRHRDTVRRRVPPSAPAVPVPRPGRSVETPVLTSPPGPRGTRRRGMT
ncbi:hypothetical protein SHIRM173S_10219 [Streptomyces hirsutus]